MKRRLSILMIVLAAVGAFGQSAIPAFHDRTNFLFTAPGASGPGLYGYDNPALLGYLRSFNAAWFTNYSDPKINNRWGLFFGIPNFGFNFINCKQDSISVTDYNLALSVGSRVTSLGLAYEWWGNHARLLKIGTLLRPTRHISLGVTGTFALTGTDKEGYVDIAYRPPGFEEFTFFGDYSLQTGQAPKDGLFSIGFGLEPKPGLRFTGRVFSDTTISLGVSLSFGRLSAATQVHFEKPAPNRYHTYAVRVGGYEPNIFQPLLEARRNYLSLDLCGPIKYRGYAMFDRTPTLIGLIELIDRVKRDPTIQGIALNLSGLDVNPEQAWELREKLQDFKSGGKHVVVYIDNAGLIEYHLASVADRVVIDPCGQIMLLGTLRGRFYLKGTLDKLGIGIDEWRYFKYKSAAETFSRESMSEADREQWQKIVDDAYRLVKEDVCASRGITGERFDELVNEGAVFMPDSARTDRLVDTVGRWEAVENMVRDLEGSKKHMISPSALVDDKAPYDDYWGDRPRICLIYALGVCAMDTGIKARQLVKDVEAAAKDPRIKAVVFRIDSPGGDALASDIVAEALRKCREKKPVIVSQGLVAGSGGYWLSMYGDTIVAAPNTITGSIGVIGYWLFNKELKQKLGVATDHVQDGAHADLGYGFPFPLIGTLPDRNLTDQERARIEDFITAFYREFVAKVAAGRRTTVEAIEPIAQGRVWSGSDGREKGLVDVLGGLDDAIRIAKVKAGLSENHEVLIVELPKPELFNLNMFQPKLIGVDEIQRAIIDLLQFYSRHNGQALTIMPMEMMLSVTVLANYR
jgi:protease-4